MKNDLHDFTTNLIDKVGVMRLKGINSEVTELLERISKIGSISVLNYGELKPEEIESIIEVLRLGEKVSSTDDSHIDEIEVDDLARVVDSLETLFRNKKLLLERQPEHTL